MMKKPKPIYLDHAASTPLCAEAARAMRAAERLCGNPGSLHSFGQAAHAAVSRARERVAAAVGAEFREIVFTGSATEANNLALRGVVKGFRRQALGVSEKTAEKSISLKPNAYSLMPKVIVSAIEHESVLETTRDLERAGEIVLTVVPVDRRGVVDTKALTRALDERTALVSVMQVNNETGVVQPISEIVKLVGNWKLEIGNSSGYPLVHTDAVQAFPFFDCNVHGLGVDLMTLSAHKLGGPKGIGALFMRVPELMHPIITGGGQEFGIRSGTESAPLMAGFAEAAARAAETRAHHAAQMLRLKELFIKELKRCRVAFKENVPRAGTAPHILNLRVPGVAAEELLVRLGIAGVAVSAGSACAARAMVPSHVLLAMGMPKWEVEESIRVSFGATTTPGEIKEAAKRLQEVLCGV